MSSSTLSLALSVAQVAAEIQCSPKTVRNMIARGELRAYRYGKTSRIIRIDRRDLERIKRPVTNLADLVGTGDGE